MEYNIQKAAAIAGLSTRTLRYYDEIGLLSPEKRTAAGYRLYGPKEMDTLQQILFYRELGLNLSQIERLLKDPSFDRMEALREHLRLLTAEQGRLSRLIATVKKTMQEMKGERIMRDEEKFEGFKREWIDKNEKKYGKEIREKFGEEAIEKSNRKLLSLNREEYDTMQKLGALINQKLEEAVTNGAAPGGPAGREIASLHRQWLSFTWTEYSPEAHLGLARAYVEDGRFTMYYDKNVPGCAVFLRDAIEAYLADGSETR